MTLGFFPDPYPDELLYSVCARFGLRMRFGLTTTTAKELFGSRQAFAIMDFPIKLDYLISQFPPGNHYTADSLIDNHTLLPFYSPFISHKKLLACKRDMRGNRNHVRIRLGFTAEEINPPKWLRFCPPCVIEDRETFGETYWHRIHQLTGVEVCPKHLVFLENSGALWRSPDNQHLFYAAEESLSIVTPRHINPLRINDAILLKIARDSEWLIHQNVLNSDVGSLRNLYFNLLLRHGYAYYNGRVRITKLVRDVEKFYSPAFLEKLQCPIEKVQYTWLSSILMKWKQGAVKYPLRHLLLITYLGCTADQFFTMDQEFVPFGKGPWPCLNKTSTHYRSLRIKKCRTTDSDIKCMRGMPLGIFGCSCGFTYKRIGPDILIEDKYRFDSVRNYGPVWERALRRLWKHTRLPLNEIAAALGVSPLTVVRHAIRLKLQMNLPGTRQVGEKTLARYRHSRKTIKESLQAYRSKWLLVLEAHPCAWRKELIGIENFLYLWLRKNDSKWLESHLPPARKTVPPRNRDRDDWGRIDLRLSAAVRATSKKIKGLSGKPIRASLNAIKNEIGYKWWFEKYLHKLPLTSRSIAKNIERFEDYLLRKVKWVEYSHTQKRTCPTRCSFTRQVSTGKTILTEVTVQRAIDAAVKRLSKLPG